MRVPQLKGMKGAPLSSNDEPAGEMVFMAREVAHMARAAPTKAGKKFQGQTHQEKGVGIFVPSQAKKSNADAGGSTEATVEKKIIDAPMNVFAFFSSVLLFVSGFFLLASWMGWARKVDMFGATWPTEKLRTPIDGHNIVYWFGMKTTWFTTMFYASILGWTMIWGLVMKVETDSSKDPVDDWVNVD